MLRFSILLLLLFLEYSSGLELPKCELPNLLAYQPCTDLVHQMKEYTIKKGSHSYADYMKNMSIVCEQVIKCLDPIHCKEAVETKTFYEKTCDMLAYVEANNKKCLTGFFSTAYLSQFSNKSSCFQEFDFLEKDLKIRQEVYSKGESCFNDYVKAHCNQSSIDYFSKNYKKFADAVSIKPSGTSCNSTHDSLNRIHCKGLGEEVTRQFEKLKEAKIPTNDTRMANLIKLCADTQACMKDSCMTSVYAKKEIAGICDQIIMPQSGSVPCLRKIMQDKPDLSKFKCLEGMDFYETGSKVTCQKWTSKRKCMKKIMADICGKESIVGFNTFADRLSKQLKCKKMFVFSE